MFMRLIVTSPAGAVAKYCDEYVCVSLCLSVCEYMCLSVRQDISGTTRAIFAIFVHVAYGLGLVLRHSDEIPRGRGIFWGFSSLLAMHCNAFVANNVV